MKHLAIALIALFSLRAGASVQVDQQNKLVNYTPTFNLEINVTPIKTSDDQYAILSYQWYMNDDVVTNEWAAIQKQYAGYDINETTVSIDAPLTLSIPAANVQVTMGVLHSANGDSAQGDFLLTKALYTAIVNAQTADPKGYAKIGGTVGIDSKAYQPVETKTLTPATCRGLIGNGTLSQVLRNVFLLGAQMGSSQQFKSVETEKLYADAISGSCFSVTSSLQAKTASELMGTRMKVALTQNVPVTYSATTSIHQDIPVPYNLAPWTIK